MKKKIMSTLLATMLMFNTLTPIASANENLVEDLPIVQDETNNEILTITEGTPSLASLSIKSTLNDVTSDVSLNKPFYSEISSYSVSVLSQTEAITIDATATDSNHSVEIYYDGNIINDKVVNLNTSNYSTVTIKVIDNEDSSNSNSYSISVSKNAFVEENGDVIGSSAYIDSSGLDVAMALDNPILNIKSIDFSYYFIYFQDCGVLEKDLEIKFTNTTTNDEELYLFLPKGTTPGYINISSGNVIDNMSTINLSGFPSASQSTPVTLKMKTDIQPEDNSNRIYLYPQDVYSDKLIGTLENGYMTFTFTNYASSNYIVSTKDETDAPSLPDVDAPKLKSLNVSSELAVPDTSKFDTNIDIGEFSSEKTSYSSNIYSQTTALIFDVEAENSDDIIKISLTGATPIDGNKIELDVPVDITNVTIKVIDKDNVNNYTIYSMEFTNSAGSFVEEDGSVFTISGNWGSSIIDETGLAVAMGMEYPTLISDVYLLKLPSVELEKELTLVNDDRDISMIIPANKTPIDGYYGFSLYNNYEYSSNDFITFSLYTSSNEYFLTDNSPVTFKIDTYFEGDGEVYIYQAVTTFTNYQEKIIGTLKDGVVTFEIDSIPTTGILHIVKADENAPKLNSLSIDGGEFDKIFDPYVKEYQATVSSQLETLNINASADPNVTITTDTHIIGDNDMPNTTKVNADGSIMLCPYADRTIITLTLKDTDNVTNEYNIVIDKGYYASENGDVYIGSSYDATIIEEDAFDVILNMDTPTLNIRSNKAEWLGSLQIPANINLTKGLEINLIDNINDLELYSITIPAGKTVKSEDNNINISVGNTDEALYFSTSNYREDVLTDGTPVSIKAKTDLEDGDIWLKMSWLDEIQAIVKDGYIYAELTQSGYYSIYPNDGETNPFETPDVPTIVENLSTNEVVYKLNETDVEELSVIATANGDLTYEWYSNDYSWTWGGTLVSTDETFTPPTNVENTTYYYCLITNTLNNNSQYIYSNIIPITVISTTSVVDGVVTMPSDGDAYIDEDSLKTALETNSSITIQGSDIQNIILPDINSEKDFTITIIDDNNNLSYTWTIPAGENGASGDINLALQVLPSSTHVQSDTSYFNPDPTSSEVIAFAHNGEMSSVGLTLTVETTVNNGDVWLYKLNDDKSVNLSTEMSGNVSNNTLTATIKNCSDWLISANRLISNSTDNNNYESTITSTTTTVIVGGTITAPRGVTVNSSTSTNRNDSTVIATTNSTGDVLASFSLYNYSSYDGTGITINLSNSANYDNFVVVHYKNDGTTALYTPIVESNKTTFKFYPTEFSDFYLVGLNTKLSSYNYSSYTSSNYYPSGSISIPTVGYIPEFRGVLLGELINLDKIDVNGMEILGWYYDAEFKIPVENTSMFVVTQQVLDNGLYPKFATTVSETQIDGSINAGFVNSSTDTNTSYIPSAVPSTVVNLLDNLF